MKDERRNNPKDPSKQRNEDPITGTPGSHPVGTGVGAAAGAAAGIGGAAAIGAAAGTTAGPVGTGVGAVAGALAGAAAGKGIAEKVNPTEEEAYWREHHTRESYHDRNYAWQDYDPAYRTGYEGYARLGGSKRNYADAESDLRSDYEARRGSSRMTWQQASPAARAAWERVSSRSQSAHGRNLEDFVGCEVFDSTNNKIGTVKCLWSDENGQPEFLGVSTGWLFGKTHVVPAQNVHIGQRSQRVRLPYTQEKVKDAPSYDPDADLTEAKQREVRDFYGIQGFSRQERTHAQTPAAAPRAKTETTEIPLSEESVKVGKREVEAGGVRLRKIIRTEVVHQPVELKREEIVIERVPASEAGQPTGQSFNEEEIYIPLRREEPVVEKETAVREKVRARKAIQSEHQDIREEVRKEDIEVESTGEARRSPNDPRERTPAREIQERENVPRSRRRA